ncbi:protein of unknown function [Anaerobranca californiensis DSM 14826]|jgi:hypothetical protein|uniref:DUF4342 domain-containing protein n=1 Tax=Anaerobranca californiensis DSM 14826 TaxID=1120989 RepID=A0A1M6N6I4_9FIRM|nr:DUF4342 domain-containing protein [Anaerobranca californiensis]SHJ91166.1 protein of unknown function [Anaerobranca californiensis DSM 14826]
MDDLRKVDIIRERVGCSYKAAHEALEKAGGDVLKAIIELESKEKVWREQIQVTGGELVEKIKEIIHQGNVTKIIVKSGDKTIVEIPVTAGAIGVLLAPHLAILGVLSALITKCTIEIERKEDN